MSFIIYHRLGSCERDPAPSIFTLLLDELDEAPEDEEHVSVSVVHESEWGLGCQRGGYVNYEHVEGDGEPRHMTNLSREKVLGLMQSVAAGELSKLEDEPWKAGY
jgi:hypothetical protein